MSVPIKRLANGTVELSLTLPWTEIKTEYEKTVLSAINDAQISGFRKGKAPRDLVEPTLDKSKLYTQAVQKLLPSAYSSAITEHHLKPILQPHISLITDEPDKDWQFTASLCESPTVVLPIDYQAQISKLSKEPKDTKLSRILEFLTKSTPLTIPDLLIEEEANHRLAALVENITQLGLTTQSYLQAKKLTPEALKADLAAQSRLDLQIELILNQIRTEQKLSDRQKTVDFLLSLL